MKRYKFNSLEDFLTDLNKVSDVNLMEKHGRLSSISGSHDFTGTHSFVEALTIAREGYDLEKLDLAIQAAESTENLRTMEVVMDVAGSVVEMGAFMAGIPENMMEFPMVEDVKFMHIVMDTGEICDVDSQVFLNKSAATAWLVDHLENNGYRVKLDVMYNNTGGEYGAEAVMVTVKDFQEPLAIGQVAGTMHPGFFRRLMFRHIEIYYNRIPWGYGRIEKNKETIKQSLKELSGSREVIYLPSSENLSAFGFRGYVDLNTIDGAKRWAEFFMNNRVNFDGVEQTKIF